MLLKILFYLSVFTLSLGQFGAILKQSDSNIYIFDLIVFIFAFVGFGYFLLIKKSLRFSPHFLIFGFFILISCFSCFLNIYKYSFLEYLISLFYLARLVSYFGAGVIVFNMLDTKIISNKQIIMAFLYSGLFICIAGVFQLILLPDFETLDLSLGWDPHKFRLASTFFDPNFVGVYLVLIVSLLLSQKKKYTHVFVIFVTSIFLTFSRSAWLALSIVVLIYGLFKNRLLILLFIFIAFSAYYAVPRVQTRLTNTTDPADSAHYRISSWKNSFNIVKDNPVLGVGYNFFRYVQLDYGFLTYDTIYKHSGAGSDSSLLFVWATTGIIGLFMYLASLISLVLNSKKNLFVLSCLGALFVDSLFINSLFYPQIMFFMFCVIFNYSFFDK